MLNPNNNSVKAENLALNYEYTLGIRTSAASASTPIISAIRKGFDNITEAINEVVSQYSFLSDEGWGSSYVTGGQLIFTLTGYRVRGDAAQDYIFSDAVYYGFGAARETEITIGTPDGQSIECPVTLAKITRSGGAANGMTAISVEIHLNGKPTVTPTVVSE